VLHMKYCPIKSWCFTPPGSHAVVTRTTKAGRKRQTTRGWLKAEPPVRDAS
jgi:hypothetical protein